MTKFDTVVIDAKRTLGDLKFLKSVERRVYANGVQTNDFVYDITLASSTLRGEVLISKFPKKIEFDYLVDVELVGDVILNSTVAGSGDFRSVAHSLTAEDIKLKGGQSATQHKDNTK